MRRWQIVLVGMGLVFLVLFPRILDLDAFRSPDEDRWMANTSGFTTKLAHGRLAELVQQPHPGITTQWLGALTIRYDDWAIRKVPLVLGQSLLILVAGYVFGRLWGKAAGVFTVLTLATNPLLYAHTRVYAMDSLLALFAVLALGFLLLWRQKKKQPVAWRYLIASAFCTAAAILSKLPGVALVPVIAGMFLYWSWQDKKQLITHYTLRITSTWLFAFLISLMIILPSFALTLQNVLGDFLEFFRSDDYQELHQLSNYYYLGTLLFFSTPLHWLALAAALWLALHKKITRLSTEQLIILLSFATLMTIQMSLGAKKGDRYILPSFVVLDVVAVWVVSQFYEYTRSVESIRYQVLRMRPYMIHATFYVLLAVLAWQAFIVWHTHPYTMAYVNPLTSHWFGDRRHGWGEGLDVAAEYLNQKTNAAELKVATYYPVEFGPYFKGVAVPAHQYDSANVDYVIIYRAMFERGEDAWETDVIQHFRAQKPEEVITLAGTAMAWIYASQ